MDQSTWEVSTICCKTSVYPLDLSLAAAVLTVGQFNPTDLRPDNLEAPKVWRREVPEENSYVTVTLVNNSFEITISPAISHHDHHFGKRITAGVYFEIAAKYAEKVGGEILQRATVEGCRVPGQANGLVIARYPNLPMSFERVCSGFQSAFMNDLYRDSRSA